MSTKFIQSKKEVVCPRCYDTYLVNDLPLDIQDGFQATVICDSCGYQFEVVISISQLTFVKKFLFFFKRTETKAGEPVFMTYLREHQPDTLFEGEDA